MRVVQKPTVTPPMVGGKGGRERGGRRDRGGGERGKEG